MFYLQPGYLHHLLPESAPEEPEALEDVFAGNIFVVNFCASLVSGHCVMKHLVEESSCTRAKQSWQTVRTVPFNIKCRGCQMILPGFQSKQRRCNIFGYQLSLILFYFTSWRSDQAFSLDNCSFQEFFILSTNINLSTQFSAIALYWHGRSDVLLNMFSKSWNICLFDLIYALQY
jgi:hypothetical protein